MKSKLLGFKKFDKNKLTMLVLFGIMLTLTFTIFMPAFERIAIAFENFGKSFYYLFLIVSNNEFVPDSSINDYQAIIDLYPQLFPSVPSLPDSPIYLPGIGGGANNGVNIILPSSWELFVIKLEMYGRLWITSDAWIAFSQILLKGLFYLSFILPFLLIFIYLFKYLYNRNKRKINNDYAEESKAVVVFKVIENKCNVLIRFIKETVRYFVASKWRYAFLVVFLFDINVFTILLEIISTMYYTLATFELETLYIGLYKLCIDLMPFIVYVPKIPVIIYLSYKMYNRRFKIAYDLRDRTDRGNQAIVKRLPAIVQVTGVPGAGKDRLMIDFDLTHERIDKETAKSKLFEIGQYFDKFDFRGFSLYVQGKILDKTFKTLADIDEHCLSIEGTYYFYLNNKMLRPYAETYLFDEFGYEGPIKYDNGIRYVSLFEALRNFAQSYYVLLAPTLLFSNISIRLDSYLVDIGNMIDFNTDYFAITVDESEQYTHYANKLNQDSLRLYKKQGDGNVEFELGRIHWSEMGKDYPNNLDSNKDGADEFDTTTDGLFDRMKMIRNGGTIDNDLYNGVMGNEQRDMNVNINYRDISSIIHILNVEPRRNCVKLFNWERGVFDKLIRKYRAYKDDFEFRRGDITLPYYISSKIMAKLYKHYTRIDNMYDYIEYELDIDGKVCNYYSFTKKIYSGRYMTDVFNEPIKERVLKSGKGLYNTETFKSSRATVEECKSMGSRMFNKLYSVKAEENEEKPTKRNRKIKESDKIYED